MDNPLASTLNVKVGMSIPIADWPILQVATVNAAKGLPPPEVFGDILRDNLVAALVDEDNGRTVFADGFYVLPIGQIPHPELLPEALKREIMPNAQREPVVQDAGRVGQGADLRDAIQEVQDEDEPAAKKQRTEAESESETDDSVSVCMKLV